MSGNGYGYYYPPNASNFPVDPNQSWSDWSLEQQHYNNSVRNAVQHHNNALNHTNNHSNPFGGPPRSQNFYNSNSRHYAQRRFNNSNQAFPPGGQPQNWQRNNYKRPRPQDSPVDMEHKNKSSKKKKKPLSQNVPSKRDWTLEDAEVALSVEKEYNKRYKNHSLIIKFPDLELNRDIVSKFHPSIENVHFQQPSTPRFCFVTLQEDANADTVISALNKIPFGDGYLTAEYKKDKEEDQNIGPEDIDPCTLYVGNLAQEVTKEDMVKMYPKQKRIDIGYAKKMKYTRYAFVSFTYVKDSIEAFKKTHSTQMYSKSLIVRFRRLHGTVGMPGESKPQSQLKRTDANGISEVNAESNLLDTSSVEEINQEPTSSVSQSVETQSEPDLSLVKQEINSSDDESSDKTVSKEYESPFMEGSISVAFGQHKPIKQEIKEEVDSDLPPINLKENEPSVQSSGTSETATVGASNVKVKEEAEVKNEKEDESSDEDYSGGGGLGDINFSNLLSQLERRSKQLESLKKLVP